MFACCDACYEKYLSPSHELLPDKVEETKGRLRKFLQERGCAEEEMQRRCAKVGECRCRCHVEGINCLH